MRGENSIEIGERSQGMCTGLHHLFREYSFIDAQADDDADEDVEANEMMNRCAPKQI